MRVFVVLVSIVTLSACRAEPAPKLLEQLAAQEARLATLEEHLKSVDRRLATQEEKPSAEELVAAMADRVPHDEAPPPLVFNDGRRDWLSKAAPTHMSWEEAKSWCTLLPVEGGRWRLPTKEELLSLYAARDVDPRVKSAAVEGLLNVTEYWSSSSSDASQHHTVIFDNAGLSSVGEIVRVSVSSADSGALHAVRCVR